MKTGNRKFWAMIIGLVAGYLSFITGLLLGMKTDLAGIIAVIVAPVAYFMIGNAGEWVGKGLSKNPETRP